MLFRILIFSIPFLVVSPLQQLFSIPIGAFYVLLVVANVLWAIHLQGGKKFLSEIYRVPLFWLMLTFLSINAASFIIGVFHSGVSRGALLELVYRFFSVGVYIVVYLLATKTNLTKTLRIYFAAALLAAGYGIAQTIGHMLGLDTGQPMEYLVPRLYGTGAEAQVFGNFLLSCLPVLVALIVLQENQRLKSYWAHLFSLLVLLLAMIMTISVGAWAGLAGSVIIIIGVLLLPKVRTFSLTKALAVVTVVFLVAGLVWTINRFLEPKYLLALESAAQVKVINNLKTINNRPSLNMNQKVATTDEANSIQLNQRSYDERVWFRQAAWNMFREFPLMGAGTGKYGALYNQYRPPEAPELEFEVRAHNQYLQILAENGIIGFVVVAAIIVVILAKSIKGLLISKGEKRAVLVGLFAALTGIAVHGYSFGILRHNYTWVLVALLMAAITQAEKSDLEL